MGGHAIALRLCDHKSKRQEHTPEETEASSNRDHKPEFLERSQEADDTN